MVYGQTVSQSATTPAAADTGKVEEITVTAERRETNQQSTPISITALTQSGLEARGVTTLSTLAVPNLITSAGPEGGGDGNFFIRGFGQVDFIITTDPGVGLYVDGIYLGRTIGAALDAGDIARIEVLRGPQGTLFGRNTLGGAISITSRAPVIGEVAANLRVTGGSRNRIDADGGISLPLGSAAAIRAYGFTRNQDGYSRSVNTGRTFGNSKRYGGSLALRLEPSDPLAIDLRADYSTDRSTPAPVVLDAVAPLPFFPADVGADLHDGRRFYRNFASNVDPIFNTAYGFSGTVRYDFGAVTLKSITAYRQLDAYANSDPDGTGYRLYDQRTPTRQHQFSEEIQLGGTGFDGRLTYLLGGYYFNEVADQELRLCLAPLTPTPTTRGSECNTWNQGNHQQTRSYAGFGQARFNVTDALSLTVGGRFTRDEKDIVSNQAFDFRPAGASFFAATALRLPVAPGQRLLFPIVSNLADAARFAKFTPKVGVEYKVRDLLLYASYTQGFRSGGFNGRLFVPLPRVPSYKPDTNDSFEGGFKADLLNRTLRFNATVFYSKYKNIQQTVSDPVLQFQVVNAGNAESYGTEIEVTAVPLDGLQIDLGAGYIHSEFKDVPAIYGPINGNSLPFTPRFTVSGGVEYTIALGASGSVTPRLNARFQSRTYFSAFNRAIEQQGDYALLDARLTWRDRTKRYSVSAFGLNLTDTTYYTFGQNALPEQGVAYNYLGRPREFGITFGLTF